VSGLHLVRYADDEALFLVEAEGPLHARDRFLKDRREAGCGDLDPGQVFSCLIPFHEGVAEVPPCAGYRMTEVTAMGQELTAMGQELTVVAYVDSRMVHDPDDVPAYEDARTYYLPALGEGEAAAAAFGPEWAFLDRGDVGADVRRWFLFDAEWHSDGPRTADAAGAVRRYLCGDEG